MGETRRLLAAGADPAWANENGYDLPLRAVHGDALDDEARLVELLRVLAGGGAPLDGESTHGESVLSTLCRLGRLAAAGFWLDAGADPAPLQWNPLHRAAAAGDAAAAAAALDAGVDPEDPDRWGHTPLLLAATRGSVEVLALLASRGVDPAARRTDDAGVARLAVRADRPEALAWLLERGLDPDDQNEDGETLVFDAVEYDTAACLRVLLGAGADVFAGEAAPPAVESLEVAELLVEAGVDPAQLGLEAPSPPEPAAPPEPATASVQAPGDPRDARISELEALAAAQAALIARLHERVRTLEAG